MKRSMWIVFILLIASRINAGASVTECWESTHYYYQCDPSGLNPILQGPYIMPCNGPGAGMMSVTGPVVFDDSTPNGTMVCTDTSQPCAIVVAGCTAWDMFNKCTCPTPPPPVTPPPPPVGFCGDGICQAGESMNTCVADCPCMNVTGGNGAAGVCACNGTAVCFSCCVSPSFNSCGPSNCALWTPPPPVVPPPVTPPVTPPVVPPVVPPPPPPPLLAPVITSANSGTTTINMPFTYQIVATNSPASYGATNLPNGLTIDTATGLITGTPIMPTPSVITLSASNATGTGTLVYTLTIVGPCGANKLCGKVTTMENGNPLVGGIPLSIRDTTDGKIIAVITSTLLPDGNGNNYSVSVPNNHTYYVIPAVDRNQSSSPSACGLTRSFSCNFSMRGLKATVYVKARPGSFIMMTQYAYLPANAPNIYAGVLGGPYYSRSAGPDGNTKVGVAPGQVYWMTCWQPNDTHPITFTRSQMQLNGGNVIDPLQTITGVICP